MNDDLTAMHSMKPDNSSENVSGRDVPYNTEIPSRAGNVSAFAALTLPAILLLGGCSDNGPAEIPIDAVPPAVRSEGAPPEAPALTRSEPVEKSTAPIQEAGNWTVQNGKIHLNGDPFFPLGIYYISHYPEQKEQRLKDLETIASLGLNMIHTPIDMGDREFLDRAAELGIYVAVEFNYDAEPLLAEFSGHPAIAFLGTFDDVDQRTDSGSQRYSPEMVQARSAAIKALAPNALTYVSAGFPSRIVPYANNSDLIAQQGYPIPEEPMSSTTTVYLKDIAAANATGDQGFIANLQSFGWEGLRHPTPTEFKNMTYQSFILGTQGVIYYTFFDEITNLNEHPELLDAMREVVQETRDMAPFLLSGKRTPLPTGRGELYAARWDHDGRSIIVVANSSPRTESVSLKMLSGGEDLTAQDLFTKKSLSAETVGDSLALNLEIGAVRVVELGGD